MLLNFHDALLMHFEVGPRKELKLTFLLDPVWNPDCNSLVVNLRCGAIANYAEVCRFFGALAVPADPTRAVAQVENLAKGSAGMRLEIDKYPSVLEILSSKIETFHGTSGPSPA